MDKLGQGEKPRRLTIALYGDLFALMHQMEAEQTSKPQELVWGIGISSWQLKTEKVTVEFEYPLLTQTMELLIDDRSMAIEIRPRATDTLPVRCAVYGEPFFGRAFLWNSG